MVVTRDATILPERGTVSMLCSVVGEKSEETKSCTFMVPFFTPWDDDAREAVKVQFPEGLRTLP